jgi:hypothetical protein
VEIITFWLIDKTFSARPKTATSKARSICDAVNTHFYHRCCRCHFCAATSIGPNENMDACSLVRYTGELRTSVGRWLARSSTCVRVSLGRWWCRTSSPAGGRCLRGGCLCTSTLHGRPAALYLALQPTTALAARSLALLTISNVNDDKVPL